MSGTLSPWLERLLGIPQAGSGEGTAWTLDGAWFWPAWATLLLVCGAAAWIVGCYLRETGPASRVYRLTLAAIRLTVTALVLFMIASFVLSLNRTGLPYVVVALDDSASMGTADRYGDKALAELVAKRLKAAGYDRGTRFNLAKSLLLDHREALLRSIESRYKLKFYLLAGSARTLPGGVDELAPKLKQAEADGEASRLGQGIEDVLDDLRGTPPSAIVLLTDGINTEGETLSDAARQARRKGVPLFSVALGSELPTRDLELTDLLVDDVVFVNDVVNFEFKLTATGFEGRQVKVSLRDKNERQPLAEQTVTIGPDGQPQKVRLPYRPAEVGEFEYVVEVENLPDELYADNNRQQRHVSVRKEQIKVLLVQSYPSYEFRYLKHLLERDSTIQLKTVLQEADLEYSEQDQSALRVFPVRREELFAYDVLIFGDVNPDFLSGSAMQQINDFAAEKGGGVVFIAGPQHTPMEYRDSPLAVLFPIDFNGAAGPDPGQVVNEAFRLQPTDDGLASPTMQLGDTPAETAEIWSKLPPLYWFFEAPTLKPAARVWAEHPLRMGPDARRLPIIAMHYVGSGKVIFHATDETWRWRYRVGDVFFARYWIQTVRYLSRSKLLGKDRSAELTVDRREYRRGEPVRVRVRFLDDRQAPPEDDGVTVVVEHTGDKNRRLTLRRGSGNRGVFEGTLSNPTDGQYHLWVAAPSLPGEAPAADFRVVAPPGERARLQTDMTELRRISAETKGRFYTIQTAGKLLGDLPEGRQVKTEPLPPIVLWNHWLLAPLLLSLLVSEWLLRKWGGML
ncbi:MAG TPA: VWA domain-containing protein [Pirellulales bacterium]|nr:VWA domain-containing protein [Pirellulales bacterium]